MAKKKAPARKTAARGARKDTTFEVEDQDTAAPAAAPRASLESGLVFVTFVALVVGLLLAQIELSGSYGRGLF